MNSHFETFIFVTYKKAKFKIKNSPSNITFGHDFNLEFAKNIILILLQNLFE